MSRLSKAHMVLLLVLLGFQAEGRLHCKEEPCSCCRTGMCADPHLSVLPCDGCIDGYSGPSCYEPCPASCVNCSQLFYEEETERVCSLCKTGFYNGKYKDIGSYPLQQDCSLHCVENCLQCTSYYNCVQCKPQYYLAYGKDCLRCVEKCNQCTSRTDCLACEDGHVWNGEICEDCEEGYFGTNCLKRCPDTCKNNQCHKSTGLCVSCKDGYFQNDDKSCLKCPNHCDSCLSNKSCVNCSAGYMGDTCNVKCSHCKPGTACDKSKGYCLHSCNNGFSGKNCNILCDSKCFLCERNNPGNCVTCASGRYGKTCINECSMNCINNSCSKSDGVCTIGCKNGYWGVNCNHSCPKDCVEDKCERHDGSCRKQCIDNPYRKNCICPGNCECDKDHHCARCLHGSGEFCDTPCSDGCVNETCNRTTGECLHGCLTGFVGPSCPSGRSIGDITDTRTNVTTAVLVGISLPLLVGILTAVILSLLKSRKKSLGRNCHAEGFLQYCLKTQEIDFEKAKPETSSYALNRADTVITRDSKEESAKLLEQQTVRDTSENPTQNDIQNKPSVVNTRDGNEDGVDDLEKETIAYKEKNKLNVPVSFERSDSGYGSEEGSPQACLEAARVEEE